MYICNKVCFSIMSCNSNISSTCEPVFSYFYWYSLIFSFLFIYLITFDYILATIEKYVEIFWDLDGIVFLCSSKCQRAYIMKDYFSPISYFLKDLFTYYNFFLEAEEGREEERERHFNVWMPLAHPPPGAWLATQACALTGNWTGDPLVLRPALNPLNHTSQD